MKVKLFVDKVLGGTVYPAGSVIDVFQPEKEAIIAAGEGCDVKDGTMARIVAYDNAGCFPMDMPDFFAAKQQTNLKK